ncbi:helix-turn-helix transcriptional regulator, partial [Neobacillus drentensis]|uniref:helix-turn-helix domain-containing protein n=1 Tax=Neobacillus drentensis TaxID=220684 RepID=UPI003002841B
MVKTVKSELKKILDERKISIRQLASMSTEKFGKDKELKFETLRRLYNDETVQYQRETIGKVCELLDIPLSE